MTRYDLTPEEQRILAEATPQEVADALAEIAADGDFWKELGSEMLQSFTEGFLRGLNR
jgi:hypothetical protein